MAFSRRRFLDAASVSVAAVATGAPAQSAVPEAATARRIVGLASHFQIGVPIEFSYPDEGSRAIAVRLTRPQSGGAGPRGDIVAYSRICTHRGCPVDFARDREVFVCPCHYSVYDAAAEGVVVVGHSTSALPRIVLAYDARTGVIEAVGIEGVLYGRID